MPDAVSYAFAERDVDHQQDGAAIDHAGQRLVTAAQAPISGRASWPAMNGSSSCTTMSPMPRTEKPPCALSSTPARAASAGYRTGWKRWRRKGRPDVAAGDRGECDRGLHRGRQQHSMSNPPHSGGVSRPGQARAERARRSGTAGRSGEDQGVQVPMPCACQRRLGSQAGALQEKHRGDRHSPAYLATVIRAPAGSTEANTTMPTIWRYRGRSEAGASAGGRSCGEYPAIGGYCEACW